MRNYKKYQVWKDAIIFVVKIYKLTKVLPDEEKFGLTSQLKRAAVSVPSNIAEGCSRSSEKDFARFLEIALGSVFEIETQLIIIEELEYAKNAELIKFYESLDSIGKQLNGLRSLLIDKKSS